MITDKEKEILEDLAKGQPQKAVASTVGISSAGVKWHLKKMYLRFEVSNTTELVAYCVEHKLITIQKHRERKAG